MNALPALNAATFEAAIWIVAPVCGLRPVRAARLLTTKLPKPVNCTPPPLAIAEVIAPVVAFKALAASAFDKLAPAAIASINSYLFMLILS